LINSLGLQFFGSLVDLDCHIQDLKLVLTKTEEITFAEHGEDDILIADIHPDITRKSFIVSLLISLDSQMTNYCQHLQKCEQQKIKWNELKGSALERFIKYSEKLCSLNPIASDDVKQKIRSLIELRNCIVHNDSCLDGFSKAAAIESFARQIEGITLENGRINLSVSVCIECADLIQEFMSSAYKSALEKHPT
jgi:hypothetical protein